MKLQSEIDSKFRFVILASKRAKQLLKGTKPKIKSKSKNPIRIAQEEVRMGLVDYEIVDSKMEEVHEPKDEGFIGEEIGKEGDETGDIGIDLAKQEQKKEKSKDNLGKNIKKKPKRE